MAVSHLFVKEILLCGPSFSRRDKIASKPVKNTISGHGDVENRILHIFLVLLNQFSSLNVYILTVS